VADKELSEKKVKGQYQEMFDQIKKDKQPESGVLLTIFDLSTH
jgi:hypothetical protein